MKKAASFIFMLGMTGIIPGRPTIAQLEECHNYKPKPTMVVMTGADKGKHCDSMGNIALTEDEERDANQKKCIAELNRGYANMNRERVASRWHQLTAAAEAKANKAADTTMKK